jgi:hypothetical protein
MTFFAVDSPVASADSPKDNRRAARQYFFFMLDSAPSSVGNPPCNPFL